MIKPDVLFTIWTPDQVAECLDGIYQTELLAKSGDNILYRKLWDMIEDYPDKRSPEEMETPDAEQSNNLAQFWDRLTEDEQILLNKCAIMAGD